MIRSAFSDGIFETDFFDLRFDAILFKSRPIGIEQQLDIVLACHVLKKHRTAFVMSDYKIILYHTTLQRKRLVNKKLLSARSWRKTTVHGPAGGSADSHKFYTGVRLLGG